MLAGSDDAIWVLRATSGRSAEMSPSARAALGTRQATNDPAQAARSISGVNVRRTTEVARRPRPDCDQTVGAFDWLSAATPIPAAASSVPPAMIAACLGIVPL